MTEHVLKEAESFLQPVLKREDFVRAKAASVVDRLYESSVIGLNATQTKQDVVVEKALSLLESIQRAISDDQASATKVLNTSSSRRLIDALLDLISLEGIYPSLLPGVGSPIERRVQSVLQGGITITDTRKDPSSGAGKLDLVAERLYNLAISGNGVAHAIHQRTLADLIAAMLQIAYCPGSNRDKVWISNLDHLIDSLSPTILFPSLISLLHSTTPDWLKSYVTIPLSLLPMRPDGVRQTITFVARSIPQRPAPNFEQAGGSEKGPTLSIEVLNQISKVLSAIPTTLSIEDYLSNVGAQLLELLGDRDQDAQRAAAYTISYGILSKRQLGQPGSVGWKIFAESLISALNPSFRPASSRTRSFSDINQALQSLSTLILTFPNPSLSRRLLSPIILPLWAVICLSEGKAHEHSLAFKLVENYANAVAGSKTLSIITERLMYDGEIDWMFSTAGSMPDILEVSIITRIGTPPEQFGARGLENMQRRIAKLMKLIDTVQDDSEVSLFFAELLKKVLKQPGESSRLESQDVFQPMIYASIAQSLISTKSSRLMSGSWNIVSLMEKILSSQFGLVQATAFSNKRIISRSSLVNIVSDQEQVQRVEAIEELENSLGICLPWIALVIQADGPDQTKQAEDELRSLMVLLTTMRNDPSVPSSIKQSLNGFSELFERTRTVDDHSNLAQIDNLKLDTELYATAMKNLQAEEPPVRVHGLSQLEALVSRTSPLVSINSAILTVLSLLQDSDSFVYLSAIKILTRFSQREPRAAIKTLSEAFQDVTEQSTLDVRLRIGEALQTIVEEIGLELPAATVKRLTEMLLYVASRRTYRANSDEAQKRAANVSRKLNALDQESDADTDDEVAQTERDLQSILNSWQGKAGAEDQRIRSSAMSILGSVFEHADSAVVVQFVRPTIEVVTQVLQHEKGQENAIARRAAVLVVFSMVNGQRNNRKHSMLVANTVTGDLSMDRITVLLQEIAVEDDDDVVRGHAENVLRAIDEWKQEVVHDLISGQDIRFGLADNMGDIRLQGLEIHPSSTANTGFSERPKIEELE